MAIKDRKLPTDPQELAEIARSALFAKFGYEAFREGQEDVVVSILSGKDTMYVAKTGGGKSVCFQIPALLLPGTTIVISPLKALMRDQVASLEKRGIRATFLNSDLDEAESKERFMNLMSGAYKLVYISPEKFASQTFREHLKTLVIPLFIIDEMDCIVSYGESSFRAEYMDLGKYIAEFSYEGKRPTIAAFTATADDRTKTFVADVLNMDGYDAHVGESFGRNISVEAMRYMTDAEKREDFMGTVKQVDRDLKKTGGVCVVFCSTRKNVDELHSIFKEMGIEAGKFHAGHAESRRESNYKKFMEWKIRFIVCTNAFGRGIDKPDVRFVIHYGIPSSMQDYVQEIGRGWRDGKESKALMFVSGKDIVQRKFAMAQTWEAKKAYDEIIAFVDAEYGCRRELIEESFDSEQTGKCWICDFCRGKEYVGKFSSKVPKVAKKKRSTSTSSSKTKKTVAVSKTKKAPVAKAKPKPTAKKKPVKKSTKR